MIDQQELAQQENFPQQPTNTFPWLKVILLIFAISIPIGIGGYILGTQKNQPVSQKQQVSISPTISSPSPTPDPTANWKTYTNNDLGYSFKYPSTMTMPSDTDNPIPQAFILYKSATEKERIHKNPTPDIVIDGLVIEINDIKDKELDTLVKPYADNTIYPGKHLNIPNVQNISFGPFPSIGITYQQLVFITSPKGNILKFDAGLVPNEYPEGYSSTFSEIFTQILSTFKFTDQNQATNNSKLIQ